MEPLTVVPALTSVKPDVKQQLRGDHTDQFMCCVEDQHCRESMKKGEVPSSKDILFIDGVLSSQECSRFCDALDKCESLSFWSSSGRENGNAKYFRDADTVEVEQVALATALWNRMSCLVDDSPIHIPEEYDGDSMWERELPGKWYPCGLNQNFLFAKYPAGGHFAPHTDGREIHSFNRRSFYSVIIFLNTIPVEGGGGTRFYADAALNRLQQSESGQWTCSDSDRDDLVLGEVAAVSGRMLIFDQRLVHEGMCCIPPHCKYIIRSDVMFERRPAVCDSEDEQRAYSMFKEAEALAEAGEIDESILLFKKACKISPDLSAMMGH